MLFYSFVNKYMVNQPILRITFIILTIFQLEIFSYYLNVFDLRV